MICGYFEDNSDKTIEHTWHFTSVYYFLLEVKHPYDPVCLSVSPSLIISVVISS